MTTTCSIKAILIKTCFWLWACPFGSGYTFVFTTYLWSVAADDVRLLPVAEPESL